MIGCPEPLYRAGFACTLFKTPLQKKHQSFTVVLFNVFLDRENKMKNVQLLGKNLILLFQDTIDVMASIWVLTKETGQSNDNVICRFKGKLRTE